MNDLRSKLERGWKRLHSVLDPKNQVEKQLLDALQQNYAEEQQVSEVLTKESERIPYAHLRKKLLDIAARERHHAELLAAKIHELGGSLPERATRSHDQREQGNFVTTLDLLELLQEEKEAYVDYLKAAHLAKEAGKTDLTGLLRQIAEEERRHRKELIEVLTKLNPLPTHS
ncbi:MAG: hypothetical protein D6743_16340 [Calditrichaeota bacterium]|nr:MAG: hypothetical protein D6743_16340 [Calditrichota bacterium]